MYLLQEDIGSILVAMAFGRLELELYILHLREIKERKIPEEHKPKHSTSLGHLFVDCCLQF